ncbi:MAG: sialate O-acetylesterase [Flavobacterium sp.]|nr:sialate O-acetylesterase [Pedobacter sp.]
MKKIFLVLSILITYSTSIFASIKLPALVGNNMVLQQQAEVRIWGWAKAGSEISISPTWETKTYSANTAKDGTWQTIIKTPIAGGPYQIKLSGDGDLAINNILIGEVWLCSGQSNMEMPLRGNSSPILNANELILNADNKNIHLFKVKRATNLTPLKDVEGLWQECTSATAREFSAMGYQFGAVLQKKLNVPVGLIMSTVGGTKIETWMSNSSLEAFPEVKIPITFESSKYPHKEPTSLFNAMIAPLTNYGIKGVIWMQGESNRSEPELYGKLFPIMVAEWRKEWNQGDFAFYYAQIAPCGSSSQNLGGAKLREAQMKAMDVIPNSGMACLLDVGMERDIHFMDKTTPAHRLAYWALAKTYGIDGIGYQGPSYNSMKIDGNKAIITFDNATYLTTYKKPLTLFEVAGADKVFYPADAQIENNIATVSSDKVQNPVAVRYAFKEWALGQLFNHDGLPASSFRTDDW